MRIIIFILLCIGIAPLARSQEHNGGSGEEVIESILENTSDGEEIQWLGEELEYLKAHPINIVRPSYGELLKIPFVSPMLAESIIRYTDTVALVDVEQIQSVALMTDVLFEKLLPFVTVEGQPASLFSIDVTPSLMESRSRFEEHLQRTKGFENNKYYGNAAGTYERLRIRSSNVEAAGVVEKDAGERYRDGLIAGYVSVKDADVLRNLVVGNFNISSSQGLVLARNISTSKGIDAVGQVKKRGSTIAPSTSTDEFRYFQGAAAQLQFSSFSLMGFFSKRKLSASIDSNQIATSFYSSGSYRTDSELKRRNTLAEQTIGGMIDFAVEGSKTISVTLMNVQYDHILSPSLLDVSGKNSITAGSIAWEIPFYKFTSFGETATNDAERFSKIVGFIVPVSRLLSVSYHHRSLSKGYVSPFARPFGERNNIAEGERGNYVGIEIKQEKVLIDAYLDYYVLPSTMSNVGSIGRETFAHISFPVTKKSTVAFHIRNKERSQIDIREWDDERIQTNYRIDFNARVTSQFSIRNRIEIVHVQYQPSEYSEKGLLTFMEVVFKNNSHAARVSTRMIYFDTPSYDSRLYQYESDIAGNFSNPPMYGKGIRWYIVGGIELWNDCVLSLKYSETKKLFESALGSGDEEIKGNLNSNIALQLDFQL